MYKRRTIMKIVGYRKILDFKSSNNEDVFHFILFDSNISIISSFGVANLNPETTDEKDRKEILDMVFFTFYHKTKEMPIQTIFKLTPGNSTDTDYILPEFEGKFKKWCVNNKIDALTKDFEK